MADEKTKEVEFAETRDDDDGFQSRSSMHHYKNMPVSKKQQWMADFDEDKFKILDPDDPLMKRFQDALKSHLLRIDDKLSSEISELVRDTHLIIL